MLNIDDNLKLKIEGLLSKGAYSVADISNRVDASEKRVREYLRKNTTGVRKYKIGNTFYYESVDLAETALAIRHNINSFENAESAEELLGALTSSDAVYNNATYSTYMSASALNTILGDKTWFVGNPKDMNDRMEYDNYNASDWENVYYSCFMKNDCESIAMWSIYAHPWEQGIRVSIPGNILKQWVKSTKRIYGANHKTKQADKKMVIPDSEFNVCLCEVAYYNENTGILAKGRLQNSKLINPDKDVKLKGFVKNEAWSYEKEIRLHIDVKTKRNLDAVAIDIPDFVIENMSIMTGPRFKGCINDYLNTSVVKKNEKLLNNVSKSIFENQLSWIPCDSCYEKNRNEFYERLIVRLNDNVKNELSKTTYNEKYDIVYNDNGMSHIGHELLNPRNLYITTIFDWTEEEIEQILSERIQGQEKKRIETYREGVRSDLVICIDSSNSLASIDYRNRLFYAEISAHKTGFDYVSIISNGPYGNYSLTFDACLG